MRHLIDSIDLTTEEVDVIINRALDIIAHKEMYTDSCHGKTLATLFYEPSTRTRLSFTAAMMELGGNVLGFSDANSSSVSKGESVADTIRVISAFADIVAMRHSKEGAPRIAAEYARVPVINAGDGGNSHPTQTMTDLLTIRRELGHFDNLTIGLCGDLKYGRTVHSLIKAMHRYAGVKFILISPNELKLPSHIKSELADDCEEVATIEEAMPRLDVLYMTRIQQERFADPNQYDRLKNIYVLDEQKMKLAKQNMIVMHPLPRVNEISVGVDADPRAAYFRQVENGKFVRMALIYTLLQWRNQTEKTRDDVCLTDHTCSNLRRCISGAENVPHRAYMDPYGVLRCYYCNHRINKE